MVKYYKEIDVLKYPTSQAILRILSGCSEPPLPTGQPMPTRVRGMSRKDLLMKCRKEGGQRVLDTRLKQLTQLGYLKKTYIETKKAPEAFYVLAEKAKTRIPTVQAEIYSQRVYELVQKEVQEKSGEYTPEEFSKVFSSKIGHIFLYALVKRIETGNPTYAEAIVSLAPKLLDVVKYYLVYCNQPNLASLGIKETLKAFQKIETQPMREVLEKIYPELVKIYQEPAHSSLKPLRSNRIPLYVEPFSPIDLRLKKKWKGRPSENDKQEDYLDRQNIKEERKKPLDKHEEIRVSQLEEQFVFPEPKQTDRWGKGKAISPIATTQEKKLADALGKKLRAEDRDRKAQRRRSE